jgi:hypothetical protein
MPIQNVKRIKEIVFLPTGRGSAKRRRSTTPLKTLFRRLTQFPSNNPLHLLQIMTESCDSEWLNVRFGSKADMTP